MFDADLRRIGADVDKNKCRLEQIDDYEATWNAILIGEDGNMSTGDLVVVMEREGGAGFRPQAAYSHPPFTSIARVMKKNGLTTTDVQAYLTWKAKSDNAAKARGAKSAAKEGSSLSGIRARLFGRKANVGGINLDS